MLAAIGLGNVSKYIQQINNTFEAFCQKSSAMHRFTKGLACCSHAKETKVQQACQQPGIGPSFTPSRPQPSPRRQARWATHVRTTWTTRWSRNGARCFGEDWGSITTGTMGCGFMFVSFSFHSYPFMILLPVFRLVRSCVKGFLSFASFLMKYPFARCIALALFYWNFWLRPHLLRKGRPPVTG